MMATKIDRKEVGNSVLSTRLPGGRGMLLMLLQCAAFVAVALCFYVVADVFFPLLLLLLDNMRRALVFLPVCLVVII